MATAFDNGPFTDVSPSFVETGRDARLDNQPPLAERILLDFEEELVREGITGRIAELVESAGRCPLKIENDDQAGKAADLAKMAGVVGKKVEDIREKYNRPLIDARTNLKAKADGALAALVTAMTDIRQRLNGYVQEQEAKRRAEQRAAEEAARRLRDEQQRIAKEVEQETGVAVAPAPTAAFTAPTRGPVARGDHGSALSARTVWKHERLVSVAKLPKSILENAQVVEAVDKVIAAMVRNGARNPSIKGVNIFETTAAQIR
jgi:hypothetical protein